MGGSVPVVLRKDVSDCRRGGRWEGLIPVVPRKECEEDLILAISRRECGRGPDPCCSSERVWVGSGPFCS
jgi:hypothetical protein